MPIHIYLNTYLKGAGGLSNEFYSVREVAWGEKGTSERGKSIASTFSEREGLRPRASAACVKRLT